ncbi:MULTISPECIES: RICIN domain-containing protein [unclassified Streptomyces]|uniref:RICIN domain-containing protein n=1 Tax=unclassified Streptomyces TaxID=2593676 RepID=UPI001EF9A17F|nr:MULTISPECIES: RICIN domain-containing protein [unclassified Streptomyces]
MGDGPRDEGHREDTFHRPAGVQRGNENVQVNIHEHRTRTGVISACAVALVCVATLIAVRVGGDGPGTDDAGRPAESSTTAPGGAPGTAPGTAPPGSAGADASVLSGQLVNGDSGLCLRVPGVEEGLVPVQDSCTGAADRTWTLATQDGGATRTLRNAHSGRCVTVEGLENFAPARQLACTGRQDGLRWQLLWGTGGRAGHFVLRSTGNAKCLVVQGHEPAHPAQQASCGEEYADQWWHLAP